MAWPRVAPKREETFCVRWERQRRQAHARPYLRLRLRKWAAVEGACVDTGRDDRHRIAFLERAGPSQEQASALRRESRDRGRGEQRGGLDTTSGKLLERIPVEVNPYAMVSSDNGQTLYVSNW